MLTEIEVKPKKLVVLDINGLLCYKKLNDSDEKINDEDKYEHVVCDKMILYLRQGIREFISKLTEVADIALWTSGSYYNFSKLAPLFNIKFKFVWYRNMVELVKPGEIETVKRVKRILRSPDINWSGCYNEDNVIVVDNDIKKVGMNKNYVIVDTYNINEDDTGKLVIIYNDILEML